ncbi:MAG: hypothetical protein ABII27_05230 [bacterium]
MAILLVFCGIMFLVLGWAYLYHIKIIFKLNNFLKNNLFNDAVVLTEHRKIGLLCILLAIIVLYVGFAKMKVSHIKQASIPIKLQQKK